MSVRLFLDRGIGETRGVVVNAGRPERLIIVRDGDDPVQALGARLVGRVRKVEKAFASAFVDLPGGGEAILALKADQPPLTVGQAIEAQIRTESRHDKLATLKFLGLAEGAPRLLEAAPDLHAQLRLFDEGEIVTGPAARAAADAAELEAVQIVHHLPGGGSIAVETTRALVAVDVDLGDRAGQEAKRAARAANMAAFGVAAQVMRLKGIGGLVVFDLVGRGHEAHKLMEAARQAFAPDNPGVGFDAVTRFGTMTLTIPRRRRPTLDILLDHDGRLSAVTLALRLVRMIEREAAADPGARLTIKCAPAVAAAFKAYNGPLRDRIGARFELTPDPAAAYDKLEVFAR